MSPRKIAAIGLAFTTGLVLTACSPGADEPRPGATIEIYSDYPEFNRSDLLNSATLIVEGTVTGTEYTVTEARFEGDTPEENPLLGLSEKEKAKALAKQKGSPTIVVRLRVDSVHKGDVKPGQTVSIVQSGGVINDVLYREIGNVILSRGEKYLIFGADSFDGAYYILGGTAGTYVEAEPGTFVAAVDATAPFETLTSTEVHSLTH